MPKTSIKSKMGLVVFGLFLCIVLLEIAMRIAGFAITSLQEYRNRVSIRERGQYRILCLGESTTAFGGYDSYPSQLEEILNQAGKGTRFSVINEGRPGTDTALIVARLEDNLDKYSPVMVIAMMGINDYHVSGSISAHSRDLAGEIDSFFQSLKVYKLIKMLRSHILSRFREPRIRTPSREIAGQQEELSLPLFLGEHKLILDRLSAKNPKAYQEYQEFKKCLLRQESHAKIEEKVEKAKRESPNNPWGYLGSGRCYWYGDDRSKAVEMFEKAMEVAPRNDWVHLIVGSWYADDLYDYEKAEKVFRKALEINPANALGYVMLARVYDKKKEYSRAEEMLRKAIAAGPEDGEVHLFSGEYYWHQGDYELAEKTLGKALEINPHDRLAYAQLGLCYLKQKKYDQGAKNIEKAIALSAENEMLYDKLCGVLAQCYTAQGKRELAERYAQKAERFRSQYYSPVTRESYRRLERTVLARGIKLVCVQYPMRSIIPLKKMFNWDKRVIFVDNEKLFKDAVRQGKYTDYFKDSFGGDFGHCTRKGNRLLAENIASVIMKRCLNNT